MAPVSDNVDRFGKGIITDSGTDQTTAWNVQTHKGDQFRQTLRQLTWRREEGKRKAEWNPFHSLPFHDLCICQVNLLMDIAGNTEETDIFSPLVLEDETRLFQSLSTQDRSGMTFYRALVLLEQKSKHWRKDSCACTASASLRHI